MSPEERIAAYDEAVQILNNYTAQEAAKIGNSQASLGLMAERLARPSGTTSGLANYTYDRTLRPTIDSLSASLTTTGRSQALEKQLYDAITAAKNRYEDAKNRYTIASTMPKTTNSNYNQKVVKSNPVGATTPEGMTSKTFTYNDGNTSYTGIVYFQNGELVGAETPTMSYNGPGATNFYTDNKQYITGWAGEGTAQGAQNISSVGTFVTGAPDIVTIDGENWTRTFSRDGSQYYVSSDGTRTRTVDDVMNALR